MYVEVQDSELWIARLCDADLASWSDSAYAARVSAQVDSDGNLSVYLMY